MPIYAGAVISTIRARWSLDDLLTADGHRLSAVFSCSLRVLPESAEQKFFEETFLSSSSAVRTEQILAHFRPRLQSTAAGLAAGGSAVAALDKATNAGWLDALRAAGDGIAFSCGIALLPPFSLELTSPSLQHERLARMQRVATERTSAQRAEHFQRAADLLRQWESLKASSPSVSPGQLLEQLSPADRGAMLESLLMASAQHVTQPDLWAVAGANLVHILSDSEPQLISLPTDAGPLRSVKVSENQLLIGAQKGIIVLEKDALNNPTVYLDSDLISEHGFTGAIATEDGIWASHRDAGIVFWEMGRTDRPSLKLKSVAKYLVRVPNSSQLLFAVGERVMHLTPPADAVAIASLTAPIVGILASGDRAIAVAEDGSTTIFDSRTLEKLSNIRPVGRVTSAALMPWLNDARLLLTTPDGPIQCIGLDDPLFTQYSGPYLGVRAVAGSISKVAAMSSDRQRIIFWNSWDGRRPAGEIHLTAMTRHRVADIAFG